MSEIKIPFGRTVDGAMVSIDAVVRGLDCACFCAACNARLVARKGEINRHHFAHHVEPENCTEARETALHKFAKQIIAEGGEHLSLPDDVNLGEMQQAELEPWLDGLRPDVLIQFGEPVAIEIRVAHPVPGDKISKLVVRKLATLEIDLSLHRHAENSEQEWRELILKRANRFWLFPPAVVRLEIEHKARVAQQAAEREQEQERARADLAEEQARLRAERIYAAIAAREREEEWQRLVTAEAERRQQSFLENRMAMEEQHRLKNEKDELAYRNYKRKLLQMDPLLEGLRICADTERHLREWQIKKQKAGKKVVA